MATFTYPHVGITTKALQRRTVAAATSTATTLLAPFMCDRGPDSQLVAIDSMDQLIRTFGSLDYSKEYQRQIINIGKWIGAGGRVLACRLITTADSIQNAVYLTQVAASASNASTRQYTWTINVKGVAVQSTDEPVITVNYDTPESGKQDLYIVYNGIRYYINLKGTLTETSETGYSYAHVNAFTSSGISFEDFTKASSGKTFLGNLVLNISKVGSEQHLFLMNSESYKSFDTGIVISKPSSITTNGSEITSAKKATYSASYSVNGGKTVSLSADAKYYGTYYNDISVEFSSDGVEQNSKTLVYSMYFDVVVYLTQKGVKKAVEKYTNVEFSRLYTISENSDYIENIVLSVNGAEVTDIDSTNSAYLSDFKDVELTKSDSALDGTLDIESILVSSLTDILKKPLETPFDVMIDCGYSKQVKLDLIKLFCNTSTDINDVVRNDAFLYLTPYRIANAGRTKPTAFEAKLAELRPANSRIDGVECDLSNMMVIDQYEKIQDIYSEESGKEVFIPSDSFFADLVPANDANNGVQWPTAGLTRGVVKGALWINTLPTAAEKQEHYDDNFNYIEKDDRGVFIMTQLTGTVDDTSLKFVNNERSLLKIKRQLTLIGRQYLHEFNDRLTKTNLLNALNTYLSDWIQNRTLSYGAVTLTDSSEDETLTDEEIEIGLYVKFTGTIEVISVNITVE